MKTRTNGSRAASLVAGAVATVVGLGAGIGGATPVWAQPATAQAQVTVAKGRPASGVIDGLFDVGGHRLYLRCTGHGSPTVVMDASLGEDSTTWSVVEPSLTRATRVCVYDRAGFGRSDPGPIPRTSQMMVDDLTTLLRVAGVPAPYVLVGHSIAGFNVQLLAREDGGHNVVGVVLIDTTPPEFIDVLDGLGQPIPPPDDVENNPERIDLRVSAAQVLAAPAFPPVPLVVLTHGIPLPAPVEEAWQELQVAQSKLSPRGRLIVAKTSGHYIQNDQPMLVFRAIMQVVGEARGYVASGAAA